MLPKQLVRSGEVRCQVRESTHLVNAAERLWLGYR
jgi:hypothetical protein